MSSKYALISVFDKTKIVEIAKTIKTAGYKIISTGGTAKTLKENGIEIIAPMKITKDPECFDGRMKTISFELEGGILYDRKNRKHVKEAKKFNVPEIEIVVCNLYPFEETIKNKKSTMDQAIESIDVGGPAMIRSGAKNFKNVLIVTDPSDYGKICRAIEKNNITEKLKRRLAAKAFYHLSFYDSQIAKFLNKEEIFPNEIVIAGRKLINLRYGENPHQKGAVYTEPHSTSPFSNLKQLAGRGLSLTNITDINAGLESVRSFREPAAAVIKHNSPCGLAIGATSEEALARAIESDPESAFGGVIVLNKKIDINCAKLIEKFKKDGRGNFDIIAGPSIDKKSIKFIKNIRQSLGIYTFGKIKKNTGTNYKWIDGGFAIQTSDNEYKNNWKVVTKKSPNKSQVKQMELAWKFIKKIKSNTILVMDKELPMTRGIGAGQTSRVKSTKIALSQAGKLSEGAVLASDSFFPFTDSIKLAAKYKIGAIIQQGGSVGDSKVIEEANRLGIPMIFTGKRAFWH